MDRRHAVRLLGAAALPGLAGMHPNDLFALARGAHSGTARASTFDEHQRATVDALAELIMPATDTPGARAAGVPAFIDVIVGEWYHEQERAAFLRGLQDVDARSQADFQKTFVELTEPQQTAILTGMDYEARAMPRGSPTLFFGRIKDLTLFGYYTSEIGMTQELGYVFMPGRYDGAAPVRTPRAATPQPGAH